MKLDELIALGLEAHSGQMSLRPRQIAEIEVREPRESTPIHLIRYVAGIFIDGGEERLTTFDKKYSNRFGFGLPMRVKITDINLKDIVSYRVLEELR